MLGDTVPWGSPGGVEDPHCSPRWEVEVMFPSQESVVTVGPVGQGQTLSPLPTEVPPTTVELGDISKFVPQIT